MKNIFTQHPHSVGETYFQHFKFAMVFGGSMVLGGMACIIHAIFPFLFPNTASDQMLKVMYRFVDRMPMLEDRFLVMASFINEKKACLEQKKIPREKKESETME